MVSADPYKLPADELKTLTVSQDRSGSTGNFRRQIPRAGSGRDELRTPNQVVKNCWLLINGLRLFLGKIDHDDL